MCSCNPDKPCYPFNTQKICLFHSIYHPYLIKFFFTIHSLASIYSIRHIHTKNVSNFHLWDPYIGQAIDSTFSPFLPWYFQWIKIKWIKNPFNARPSFKIARFSWFFLWFLVCVLFFQFVLYLKLWTAPRSISVYVSYYKVQLLPLYPHICTH